jgi:hypothetical protein
MIVYIFDSWHFVVSGGTWMAYGFGFEVLFLCCV